MRLQSLVSIFLILIGSCGLGFLFIKNHIASTGPISVFPKVVDIGEKKIGDLAVAEISIGNKGNAPLLISGIASSCGCMSIEFLLIMNLKNLIL